jgi:transposase-like protein
VDRSGAEVKVRCPQCGDEHPRRRERKGFLETRVLPVLGYYPWMCATCKSTFLLRKRYRRKSKKDECQAETE